MRTSRTGRSTDRRGFTLLELALVLFLIGLGAALAIPRLPDLGRDGPQRSARRIAGTAQFLFNEAALARCEQRLIFDLDRRALRPRTLRGDGELVPVAGLAGESLLPAGVRFLDVAVAGRETVTSGETVAAFAPSGWLPETVIHLQSEDGAIVTVRLLSYTGGAEIYDGYRTF